MIKLHFSNFAFLCIFIILSNVTSTTSYNKNQIPDAPQFNDKTYLGYEYGSAGISLALLDAYSLPNLDNTTKKQIMNITLKSLEKLWDARIVYNGVRYPTWTRSVEEQYLSVYPGIKYGAPGIIQAFLKMFETTDDSKWLNRAEEAFWYLSTQAINASSTPHWPYHFSMPKEDSGVSITDLKYGSTGVLSITIDLFKVTQNRTYLDYGNLIISWLNEISITRVQNDVNFNIIPWYYIDGIVNTDLPFYTTYGFGLSGIAPHLFNFGKLVQSDEYMDWALELGRFLVEIQLDDGSWYSASDAQSTINVGFDNGVSGILQGLFELNLLANSSEFDDAITLGINWLLTRYMSNSTHVGFFNYLNSESDIKITNSLYDGNIGILRTLTKLKSFLTIDQVELVILTYKWLLTSGSFITSNGDIELLFLLESPNNYQFVDFSYAQGLAGFLSELVNLESVESISNLISFNFTKAVVAGINTFDYFQQINGHWQRQYIIPSGWILDHFTIIDFSDDDIPLNTVLISSDTSIMENNINNHTSEAVPEGLFYLISVILVILLVYILKRTKITNK